MVRVVPGGKIPSVLAAIFAAVPVIAGSADVSAPPPPSSGVMSDAERLVFLLQYVGGDYAAAVRDGVVVDESEYRENRDFVATVKQKFEVIRDRLPKSEVGRMAEAVRQLDALVASRGDAKQVRAITEALIPEIVRAVGLHAYPRRRPDTEAAARLYAENCVPCHGPRGAGDGPRAKTLDPPPARFTDRARMDSTAPYVFYNAITLGVDDTAMASFADSLSDQQRWDLAFYLWSFAVEDGADPAGFPAIDVSLRDLATRSSSDLIPELRRLATAKGKTIDDARILRWAAALRAHPPRLDDTQERLARLRVDLAGSVELLGRGEFDAAADRVTSSYLSEFEPLEPEIDRRDSSVRQAFEHDLIEFRSALRRSDSSAAAAAAERLGRSVERAAELLSPEPRSSAGRVATIVALAGAAFAAAALLAWGFRKREVADDGRVG